MSPEDLQGQLSRSAAVERELREEIGKLRAELAEAKTAAARTCYQGGTAAGEVLAKMQAENSRLQRDVLTALVLLDKAKVQREGGRTDAIAMERSAREVLRALVPVVCEHCPDHPHPLNDDNRECKRPRPASHRHASPDPAVGPAQDGAGADLPRSGIPLSPEERARDLLLPDDGKYGHLRDTIAGAIRDAEQAAREEMRRNTVNSLARWFRNGSVRALLNTYVADQIQRWAPAPPRSGIPPIDHDFQANTWPKRDECDARVSDNPDGRPSRQCGRPRREHRNPEGAK